MLTDRQLHALLQAQMLLGHAQTAANVATIASICVVPSSVRPEDLRTWQDEETRPAQTALRRAEAELDRLVEEAGLSRLQWAQELDKLIQGIDPD